MIGRRDVFDGPNRERGSLLQRSVPRP